MSIIHIILLAIVQGFAELLPVSSSAHVVVAEKLMGLDPTSPQMTLLLVMLHTGTMFAVIVYFWRQWRREYFHSFAAFKRICAFVILATLLTGVIGEAIVKLIEHTLFRNAPHAEIENLFGRLDLIAPALAAAGVLILIAGLRERKKAEQLEEPHPLTAFQAAVIGAVQGLCLPFRGFSRSGATISAGMLAGVAKSRAETFSFALAVALTPAIVGREALRLIHAEHLAGAGSMAAAGLPSFLGAALSFLSGLLALKWLSRWLEGGRWYLFGFYCLFAAAVTGLLYKIGY